MKPCRTSLFLILCLCLTAPALMAQDSSRTKERDPFREDPLFTRPLHELLNLNGDTTRPYPPHPVHHYLHRMNEHGMDLRGTLEAGPYRSNPLYGTYPTLPMIHFNRVDGLFLGLRKERMQWYDNETFLGIPNIRPHGMIGYGFAADRWQYSAGLERYFGRSRKVLLGGEVHNATTTDDYWRVGLNESSVTSFFGGYDQMDYYGQNGWGLYLLFRTDRLLEGGVAFNDDRYSSLDLETGWALFGSGGRYRPNPAVDFRNGAFVDTLQISALTFAASFNPKRLVLAPRFTFSMRGEVELADPGITSSEYRYRKYLGELVTFLNFEHGGVVKHRLRAGSITGEAPLMKQFELGGIGSLRALPYKSLSFGNQMLLSNLEIQFGTPLNSRGNWIDLNDFHLSLFLDSGWVNTAPSDGQNLLSGFSGFTTRDLIHNAGIGAGSGLVRCELAWDLENSSRAPVLWVRFNPTF